MNNKSLFYDPNSRYNHIDNTKILFLTPNQLNDLDIGFPIQSTFNQDEYNTQFPILLDTLKEMVKETTLGEINGSEIGIPIEMAMPNTINRRQNITVCSSDMLSHQISICSISVINHNTSYPLQ